MPSRTHHRTLSQALFASASTIVDWTTPRQTLTSLVNSPGDGFIEWEHFRDNLCRKWVNLNVMCGLVMGGVSTILFSDYPLSSAVFSMSVISLLSSLIAIGFGGLSRIWKNLMEQHPMLFMFSLTIPQTWTFISFASFFAGCIVLLWQATNKGWTLKAGTCASIVVIALHLIGFVYVFRPDNAELYDQHPLDPTESSAHKRHDTVFGVEIRAQRQVFDLNGDIEKYNLFKVANASRPPSWTFGPILFGIGLLQSQQIPRTLPVLALAALQIFSLSAPLSIVVFGINDVYDFSTDSRNPRKIVNGLQGGVLQPEYHSLVRTSACVSTIFILGVSLLTRRLYNVVAAVFLLSLSWQYSAPPLRLKEVPVFDSLSNGLIVFLTWFCGFSFSGLGFNDVPSKGFMLGLCTAGVHALGAVIDVEADIAAGQRTIATAFGKRPAVAFSALCYILAATTEEPNSIFGVYLWLGSAIMVFPCMDYFSKFLKGSTQSTPKAPSIDYAQEFHKSWEYINSTLTQPDERQLLQGIKSTNVPGQLRSMVDALVWESTRTEEGGTGACLEYLLKNDVLGSLVRLSESDRPSGIQAEVLRAVQNMVILLDEQFLVHSAVHRAVLRLLRTCVGDDLQEQLDGRSRVLGAAGSAIRSQPSEYEEDLVNLLCILCSRIMTYRELLMIFFHDKHWYRSEPLFALEEEEEDEEKDQEDRDSSPAPSQETITTAPPTKKTEYEFLLFNYLLRFVHREGKIGEFSRAGLLFLMDVAMSPGEHPQLPEEVDSQSDASAPTDPIVDAALALAEYILDGDFSEVLGAGLSAVYSLLPSKLEFFPKSAEAASGATMIIGATGPLTAEEQEDLELEKERNRALGMEDANNPDFKQRLDHFLKILEFLQDVLKRNTKGDNVDASALVGTAIVHSILDAVRRIFLENVLYPSILECSDMDGSAVAVMSYIEVMLRTLDDGPLSDLLVTFLANEENDEPRPSQRPQALLNLSQSSAPPLSGSTDRAMKHRRRKSSAMTLLEMEAPDTRKPTGYFTTSRFTLKDLLMSNLRSESQATATTALQLLQTLMLRFPQLTVERIFIVIPDPYATSSPPVPSLLDFLHPAGNKEEQDEENFHYPDTEEKHSHLPGHNGSLFALPLTTYNTHEREMNLYLNLISRVDPSHSADVFSTGYDYYLHDALLSIQNRPAFQSEVNSAEATPQKKHRLNVNDPILSRILESLRRFFSNTPDYNIALTGFLAKLALHPDRSLAGWLTFSLSDPHSEQTWDSAFVDDDDDRSIDFGIEESLVYETNILPAAPMDADSRPVLHTIYYGLVNQLERYRQMVDDFDKFLVERRQGLLFSENLTDALNLALDVTSEDVPPPLNSTPPAPHTPTKPKAKSKTASSFVSFLTPKKNKSSPAQTSHPELSTPSRSNSAISASPFGAHYQQTGSIRVQPLSAPAPSAGSWVPVQTSNWDIEEEDVFGSGWSEQPNTSARSGVSDTWEEESAQSGDNEGGQELDRTKTITLSQLLDNVVILEESIKELVAIIHARRSLGVDSIRYL
ncbi:hypothetical protein NP233_g3461 [Leucocoprinus birnbaumii]|uniref:FHF complex subunit HOOK-interacting protein C-terminal domain-containing protein n=1 Tax=Leucocoprinus birnbaumii TaxID=56174 RepID=A0AAD5YYB4_9AGAR|nr:hypothetical protein NP233_g3461 [Leucocoprinus birnbaumii]